MLRLTATKSRLKSLMIISVLACAPTAAFGSHGKSSHGGGGSHHGSSHRGGGSHGGGFHLGKQSHSGGGGHFSGGSGSHWGSSGHSSSRNSFMTRSAPRQTNQSSFARSGRTGGSYQGFAHANNQVRSSDRSSSFHNSPQTAQRTLSSRGNFGADRPPFARTSYIGGSDRYRSPDTSRAGSNSGFNANRPGGKSLSDDRPSQDRRVSSANNVRFDFSRDSNRPPAARSGAGNRPGQSRSVEDGARASAFSSGANRPPSAQKISTHWSGSDRFSSVSGSRSNSASGFHRDISNSANSRFGNSRFGDFSSANSRFRSNSASFSSSNRGGWNSFDRRRSGFYGGRSFGGGDDAWVPDLFGLALDLGNLAIAGAELFGPGLTAFGLRGVGFLGWGLLNSVSGDFSSDASQQSPNFGSCPIMDPAGNWACP
jgi:hypothetical protein